MRVLQIFDELCPSGAETMLSAALPHWKALDTDVEVLSTGASVGSFSCVLSGRGCCIHHIPFSKSPRFFRDVYRLLRDRRYDAVHIQPERANFWYAMLSRLAGRPVVVRTINSVFPFSGFLRLRRYLQRLIMSRLLGVEMVAVSKSVQAVERRYYDNPSRVISGWFDSARYAPPSRAERLHARQLLGIEDGATAIVSVGNCFPVKNHCAIVEALAQLSPDVPLLYLHAGQEDPQQSERIQARQLGVERRIRFLGTVLDIRPVLHAADAFVMPSAYEGMGIAAIEAMASGLPCILSNVQGLRDFGAECDGIVWVEPDAASIAAALYRLCSMPAETRARTGIALSQAVHRVFGAGEAAAAYARLYSGQKGSFTP